MKIFGATNILLPKAEDFSRWAVIACDQFTSQPEYWQEVKANVGTAPSTLNLVLPECYLQPGYEKLIPVINANMEQYLAQQIFQTYPDSYVYIERTLLNGKIRRGLLGAVDLEEYSYAADASCTIRATEQTVLERIPPRVAIRENAPVELPHIILFCDDAEDALIGSCEQGKADYPVLYDFDLMCGGGHITGWLISGEAKTKIDSCFADYVAGCEEKYAGKNPVVLAVGDGNHSLATAKACYEKIKAQLPAEAAAVHPARYAMVEVENIQDAAQEFEPIHRVIANCQPKAILQALEAKIGAPEGYPLAWVIGAEKGTICVDPAKGKLAVKIVQDFLDSYLAKNQGDIDYIHGEDTVEELAKAENTLGLILPPFEKGALFDSIQAQGALPRKTFSIGHAKEKRYYLEARQIKA